MGNRGTLVKGPRRRRANEGGQVAILFALVFTFLFVLFAFVVDFGHLVNDKINLQLAADSAAYAGAAWQARHLNRIAAVNYHLRQDLKEFAMRVNVTHLRQNRDFPRGDQYIKGGDQRARVNPWICQQAHGYKSLSGVQYAQDTDICRNADPITGGLPPIVVPPVIAAFDPFTVAVVSQIQKIQEASDRECAASAEDNRLLAEHLVRTFRNRANFHAAQVKELANYMNDLNREDPNSTTNPMLKTAVESAKRNLTLSNNDDFKFEVIKPRDGEYVKLEQDTMRGSVIYLNFQRQGGGGCVGQPAFLDFDDIPVNFHKVQEVLTYFSVKLTSKPKLLFMPSRWAQDAFPELVAYSAAKPFGSRIGPNSTVDQLVPLPNRPGNVSRIINFSFKPGDQNGIYNAKVMAYLDALHPFLPNGRPSGVKEDWPEPDRSENIRMPLEAIRSPTIFDALFFTVFPDPGQNRERDYMEPQYAEALYPDYLEAADAKQNIVLQNPQSRTPAYLPTPVGSKNRGPGWIQLNASKTEGSGPYGDYASEQPASHSVETALGLLENPQAFGFADKSTVHSAWTPAGRPGRIGYSVKLVAYDALLREIQVRRSSSNSLGPISNPPTGDPNLSKVYH